MLAIAELPNYQDSHSIVVFGKNRDNYSQPKWRELPKNKWGNGY
jgi:hypothetical protein